MSEVKETVAMNYWHPLWNSFINDLATLIQVLKCDARSLRITKILLNEKHTDCGPQETEYFMQEHGGFCDCEVLVNVVEGIEFK